MTAKLRLTGGPAELARILDAISSVLDVATDGRTCPQRSGFGVRCYAEARLPTATTHAQQEETPQSELDQYPRKAIDDRPTKRPTKSSHR